ncbi:NYN domain-containing protein [Massilia norwichensis]|uniref:NYN domain-containing protein n=1 Tax=Massilia norwichensis TaxID=1442366 RepID=A0ABT2ABZ7_9BURK|nr:NYN domain-containing protein [Massilia norwichensis]MCS0591738.1 NYN domain-containing protein [Massilia norwichensis]
MASSSENISMAVFCDFENVALGVRDANYEKFDIKPVLERLLLKGSIVVKKAYCDWDRYKGFKATMHEANFELIEIPHVRQSGKNSADIRMVVDALDLCYTKAHVDTFVIVSGDSDFSPLVSKLRENAKRVIGVGVKNSTSDLLVANCDEFIFYDDLVREVRRAAAKRDERKGQGQQQGRRPADDSNRKKEDLEARKLQALEMVVETFDALVSERGDTGKIWASLLKDTLKRRRPDFSETFYGFRTFGNLLEEAQTRGLFEFGRDEKSGTYVYRSAQAIDALAGAAEAEPLPAAPAAAVTEAGDELAAETQGEQPSEIPRAGDAAPAAQGAAAAREPRRRGGRGRKGREQGGDLAAEQAAFAQEQVAQEEAAMASWPAPTPDLVEAEASADVPAAQPEAGGAAAGTAADGSAAAASEAASQAADAGSQAADAAPQAADTAEADKPAAPVKERRRTPRKPSARKAAAAADSAGEVSQAAEAGADNAAIALDAQSAVAPAVADSAAPIDAGTGSDGGEDGTTDADPSDPAPAKERKKSTRPAHKAPSRKPATRARRPAKPKTPEGA